jgi:glycosyltransferase involved in cell wall biosynthesis
LKNIKVESLNQSDLFQVSVIIPVYNSEMFIKDSVDSALNLPEVGEVLLIDDGSTDNSLKVCLELQSQNKRVKALSHKDERNHGPAASRNLGILNASSEFVSFLDADDVYLAHRFSAEKKIFQSEPEIDGVYGCSHTIFISESGKQQYYKVESSHIYTVNEVLPPELLFNNLLFYWNGRIHTSAITVRRSAFQKVGLFNEELRWAEDTELWLRLAYKVKMVSGVINEPIALRRIHDRNIVHQIDKARIYNDKMYHTLFEWALLQKPSFEVLNNIINAKKLYSYSYIEMPIKKYIWLQLFEHPKIFCTLFFWKKLKLLYFKN